MKSLTQNKEKREYDGSRQGRMGSSVEAVIGADVRLYFAGLESLAREARASDDPRVVRNALSVLALQQDTAIEFLAEM